MVPNDTIQDAVKYCEIEFRRVIDLYEKSKYLDKKLCHHIRRVHPQLEPAIVTEFVRVRIRIRVKCLNQIRRGKLRHSNEKLKQFVKSKK